MINFTAVDFTEYTDDGPMKAFIDGRKIQWTGIVPLGTEVIIPLPAKNRNNPVVRAFPGGGGTAKVQDTISPSSAVIEEIDSATPGVNWSNWVPSPLANPDATIAPDVSVDAQGLLSGVVVAIKLSAATADAVFEIAV